MFRIPLDEAEAEWLQEYRGKLLFAPDPFYAPFEYYDEQQGTTTGLMHDYLKLVKIENVILVRKEQDPIVDLDGLEGRKVARSSW